MANDAMHSHYQTVLVSWFQIDRKLHLGPISKLWQTYMVQNEMGCQLTLPQCKSNPGLISWRSTNIHNIPYLKPMVTSVGQGKPTKNPNRNIWSLWPVWVLHRFLCMFSLGFLWLLFPKVCYHWLDPSMVLYDQINKMKPWLINMMKGCFLPLPFEGIHTGRIIHLEILVFM